MTNQRSAPSVLHWQNLLPLLLWLAHGDAAHELTVAPGCLDLHLHASHTDFVVLWQVVDVRLPKNYGWGTRVRCVRPSSPAPNFAVQGTGMMGEEGGYDDGKNPKCQGIN